VTAVRLALDHRGEVEDGRIKDGAFLMDLRCLDDESAFIAQLGALEVPPGAKGSKS